MGRYYRFLAKSVTQPRVAEVWSYHRAALREAGYPLESGRMIKAIIPFWAYALKHPKAILDLGLRLMGVGGPVS
jgi:hypothetical protein